MLSLSPEQRLTCVCVGWPAVVLCAGSCVCVLDGLQWCCVQAAVCEQHVACLVFSQWNSGEAVERGRPRGGGGRAGRPRLSPGEVGEGGGVRPA